MINKLQPDKTIEVDPYFVDREIIKSKPYKIKLYKKNCTIDTVISFQFNNGGEEGAFDNILIIPKNTLTVSLVSIQQNDTGEVQPELLFSNGKDDYFMRIKSWKKGEEILNNMLEWMES